MAELEHCYLWNSQTLGLIYLHCNLVTFKILQSLFLLLLLPHADPGVGDQNIAAMGCFHRVIGEKKLGSVLERNTTKSYEAVHRQGACGRRGVLQASPLWRVSGPPELHSSLAHIPADPQNRSQPSLFFIFPGHSGSLLQTLQFHILSIYVILKSTVMQEITRLREALKN